MLQSLQVYMPQDKTLCTVSLHPKIIYHLINSQTARATMFQFQYLSILEQIRELINTIKTKRQFTGLLNNTAYYESDLPDNHRLNLSAHSLAFSFVIDAWVGGLTYKTICSTGQKDGKSNLTALDYNSAVQQLQFLNNTATQ